MALTVAEFGCQKSIYQVFGDHRSHHSAANTKNVHVVMLDSLVSRIVVLHQPGPDSRNLVRANRGAHSAPTCRDAAFHLAGSDCTSERDDEIRVIVAWIQTVRPVIDDFMPR